MINGEHQLVLNTKFHRMLHSDEYRKQLVAVVADETYYKK